GERLVDDYKSILKVDQIDVAQRTIEVELGNIFEEK
ncbi:TPA: pur operon repressor, partial [Streptococcus agalactiae]